MLAVQQQLPWHRPAEPPHPPTSQPKPPSQSPQGRHSPTPQCSAAAQSVPPAVVAAASCGIGPRHTGTPSKEPGLTSSSWPVGGNTQVFSPFLPPPPPQPPSMTHAAPTTHYTTLHYNTLHATPAPPTMHGQVHQYMQSGDMDATAMAGAPSEACSAQGQAGRPERAWCTMRRPPGTTWHASPRDRPAQGTS
jgi:hypothetical protein